MDIREPQDKALSLSLEAAHGFDYAHQAFTKTSSTYQNSYRIFQVKHFQEETYALTLVEGGIPKQVDKTSANGSTCTDASSASTRKVECSNSITSSSFSSSNSSKLSFIPCGSTSIVDQEGKEPKFLKLLADSATSQVQSDIDTGDNKAKTSSSQIGDIGESLDYKNALKKSPLKHWLVLTAE